jgi:hypothetical protein
MPETLLEKKEELEEKPPEPVRPPRGFQCKWCKQIGPNPVRRTCNYVENVGMRRIRFCLKCRREYDSWEK